MTTRVAPTLFLLLASACATDDLSDEVLASDDAIEETGKADGTAATATLSHIGDAVVSALDTTAPGERGRTWNVSYNGRLDARWLVQTPPAAHWGQPASTLIMPKLCTSGTQCDLDFGLATCTTDSQCGDRGRCAALAATTRAAGGVPRKLCTGHSDGLLDELHGLISSARASVDLTSLQPPDGRYEAAIRNAITYLGASGRAVNVRLLFGTFPVQGVVDSSAILKRLTRDVPASAKITVSVGGYRSSNLPPSWNHSKIVAIDGATTLVGGHNLWTKHYLDIEPVHDLSMRVTGQIARDAHRFANAQWRWTCANRTWITRMTWSVTAFTWSRGSVTDQCPSDLVLPAAVASGGATTIIAAGRLAWVDAQNDANQGDLAQVAMIEAAERTIHISQQDVGPVKIPVLGIPISDWPREVLDGIGAAMARGVDVYIVVSDPASRVGGLGPTEAPYSNGWSLVEIAREIRDHMAEQPGLPRNAALDQLVCQRLHLAPLRFSADDTYPTGGVPGNHAKLLLVDDAAFYIGSQNLYPAGLTEYGHVVDDAAAAATIRATYWDPMWIHASRRAVTGAGTTCQL